MTVPNGQRDTRVENATATSHGIRDYLPMPMEERQGVGLCLSGGGYRAALFHLGGFRRLNELGLLSRVDTFSAVSGGSISAGVLAAHLAGLPENVRFGPNGEIPDFDEGVAKPIRRLAATNIRTKAALARLKPGNWLNSNASSEALADRYVEVVSDRTIADLPRRPRFIFCATDLRFRTQWTVDGGRNQVGDRVAGYMRPVPSTWSMARAIAASSCFPIIFAPVALDLDPATSLDGEYQGKDRDDLVRHMALTDGGIYDNLALEPVWRDHAVVLVSDGGPSYSAAPDFGPIWRSLRYIITLLEQSTDVRKRWLISGFLRGDFQGAYWGMGSLPSHYEPDSSLPVYPDRLIEDYISQFRIEFDETSEGEMAILENHGYLMAEIAVRRHVRALEPYSAAVAAAPWPEWLDPARVERTLARSHKHLILGRGRWW